MKKSDGKKAKWLPENRATLLALYKKDYSDAEIADILGLELRQVYYAVSRAKRGLWGEEYRLAFGKGLRPNVLNHLDKVIIICDRLGVKYSDYQKYTYLAKAEMLLPTQAAIYEQIMNFLKTA